MRRPALKGPLRPLIIERRLQPGLIPGILQSLDFLLGFFQSLGRDIKSRVGNRGGIFGKNPCQKPILGTNQQEQNENKLEGIHPFHFLYFPTSLLNSSSVNTATPSALAFFNL